MEDMRYEEKSLLQEKGTGKGKNKNLYKSTVRTVDSVDIVKRVTRSSCGNDRHN